MEDEAAWRRATEHMFQILALPQPGRVKLDVCLAYLQASTRDALNEHPREYEAAMAVAFAEGATWDQVAAAADIDRADAQRRWGQVGPAPVSAPAPAKPRWWQRPR